jgi:hypothetical protein
VVGGLGLLAAVAYLRTATTSSTGSHVLLGGCCPPLARLLARLPPSTPRQVSAIFKIIVGLVQCLSTLRSFSRVLWPDVFTDFISAIDQFTVEAFSIVPAECIVGQRLGFYYELVATLLLPALSFGVVMLMALLLYGCELHQGRRARRQQLEEQTKAQERAARSSSCGLLGTGSDSGADSGASSSRLPTELQAKLDTRRRHHRENSLLAMLNRPQVWTPNMSTSYPYTTTMAVLATAILIPWSILTKVWTLNIWVWLLLYPSVTRKALQTFDCIELLGETYLRADPAINCSGDEWWFMAVLASVGVFVTCILAPIALVRQTPLDPKSNPKRNPDPNPKPDLRPNRNPDSIPKPIPHQVRQTSRKHASSGRMQRSRVALLTNTYKDKYHYWEAVDLTRKLLLTSVVLLVGPDSVVQLWFVTTTGLAFLVLFLALSPYRDEAAGRIQLAALVQLEFTYVTAAL